MRYLVETLDLCEQQRQTFTRALPFSHKLISRAHEYMSRAQTSEFTVALQSGLRRADRHSGSCVLPHISCTS